MGKRYQNALIPSLQWPHPWSLGLSIVGHLGSPKVQHGRCFYLTMRPSSTSDYHSQRGYYGLWVQSVKTLRGINMLHLGVTTICFLPMVSWLKYCKPSNIVPLPPHFIVIPSGRVSKIEATITDKRKILNYSPITLWCNMLTISPRKLNHKSPRTGWTMDTIITIKWP